MAVISACEILPGDNVAIDARHEHEDLAGLMISFGVLAVAQSLKSKDFLIFPDDPSNPSAYVMDPKAAAVLQYRGVPAELTLF